MSGAVLITGASTGIGRACALDLDRRGFQVFAGVRKTTDADALRAAGSERLVPVLIDVTNALQIAEAVDTVSTAIVAAGQAGLLGLVNNAGVNASGPLEYLDLQALRDHLEINLVAQVAVTQAFLPLIRRARGRIVFMGSMGGYLANAFVGPYSAAKFGIEAIADTLRRELRHWGIEVILIQPGSIRTEIWDKGFSQADRVIAALPAEGRALYDPFLAPMLAEVHNVVARGIAPDAVAEVVHRALTAARPHTRYRVGVDAKAARWMTWLLPDRWVDEILRRVVGLPR